MINIVIFGAPGSGKGTQSDLIAKKYGLTHVSMGEVFREEIKAKTKLGILAHQYINKGQLVPDALAIEILDDLITKHTDTAGFILDGFPRTLKQGQALEKILTKHQLQLNVVVSLDVEENELTQRLIKRGKDSGRSDDTLETIKSRLDVYHAQTEPLKKFYAEQGKLENVHGEGTIKTIFSSIAHIIEQYHGRNELC